MNKQFFLCLGALTLAAANCAQAQPRGNPFAQRAAAALAEPFIGLTTDGQVVPGLFRIQQTGADTAAVREAAQALLDVLNAEQREQMSFPINDTEWRNWANVHLYQRQGVGLLDMNDAQRAAAFSLLRTALSSKGYETSRDIMRLNHHLAELVSNFDEYGEDLYWFTMMGTPSASEPWGWQLDGHHLVVNYFVLGDQVVMTPTFMGSEPIKAASGKYEGTQILEVEQSLALTFMQSLDTEQRSQAILSRTKSRGENQAEMLRDNVVVAYQGLPVTALSETQRGHLLNLLQTYVGNISDAHAALKMDEIRAHLDDTYFAWKGTVEADGVFYYRIQSPVIYIEFDHQGPTALSGPRDVATQNHIHSVVRTPNGNDYGRDLLRQHYEAFRGDPNHGHSWTLD
jgi:hypothetical protein